MKLNIIRSTLHSQFIRYLSTSRSVNSPGKVVFISQSTDVYSNLAFEDWLYQNWNFEKKHALYMWRNSPAVIIGRHQNPYLEANIPYLESAGVPVVRRNSGGGTVYHDLGNLNCTFFTPKNEHDRKWNLELICKTVNKDFAIDCQINKKHDVIIGNSLKVSGTAAKIGGNRAYHHCTLLVATDKVQLKLALQGDKTIKSKATESISSNTANLQEFCPNLTVETLLSSIGRTYLQSTSTSGHSWLQSDGFTLVKPTEDWFPGLDVLVSKLKSWEWLYGMTPLFKITRPISIEDPLSEGNSVLVSVEVYHGIIKNIAVVSRTSSQLKNFIENHVGAKLNGNRFSSDIFSDLENKLLLERDFKPHSFSL